MNKTDQNISLKNRKQVEVKVPGMPGLYLATYPSGRKTYIQRFRNPVTGKKNTRTLGEVK